MKKKRFRNNLILVWSLIFSVLFLNTAPLFASGHGCATQEADRDGDGVPDRSDDYPDDPTRTGKEGDVKKACGDQVPVMRLFFIPFGSGEGVTAAGIESSSVTSLIACSDDGIGGAIKNILGETPSAGTSTAGTGTSSSGTTGSGSAFSGTGTSTSGLSGSGAPSGSSGSGNSGTGTASSGNSNSETSVSGTAPSGNSSSGLPGSGTPGPNPPSSGTFSTGSGDDFAGLGAPLGPGAGVLPNHDSILKTLDCATRVANGKIVPCKEIFPDASETGNGNTPWPASYDQIWKDEKCGQKDGDGSFTFCVPTDKGIIAAKTDADKVELFILQLQNLGVPLQLITGIVTGDLASSLPQGEKENGLWQQQRCGQKDERGGVIECRSLGNNLLVSDSSSGTPQVSLVSLITSSDINALPAGFTASAGAQSLTQGKGSQKSSGTAAESLGEDVFYCGEKDPWGRKVDCKAEAAGLKVSTVLGSDAQTLAMFGFASSGNAATVNEPASNSKIESSEILSAPKEQGSGSQAPQCGVPDKDGVYHKCPCQLPGKSKKLNKNKIRLKAEFPGDKVTFYADDQGVVLKTHSDKKISDLSCLSDHQMKALEKEIQKAAGNTDLSGKTAPALAS